MLRPDATTGSPGVVVVALLRELHRPRRARRTLHEPGDVRRVAERDAPHDDPPARREEVRERAQRAAGGAHHRVGDDVAARLLDAVAANAEQAPDAVRTARLDLGDPVGAGACERRRPALRMARCRGRDDVADRLPARQACEERERACRAQRALRDHERSADVALVDVGAGDGVTGRQRDRGRRPDDGGATRADACWYR